MRPGARPKIAETYHIIKAMKATGNQPGIIARWKEDVAAWAQMHPTDPNASAVLAWLPLWQSRPFYTVDELAPMWPALAIVTEFRTTWPSVVKSPKRLERELDFYRLPRLPAPYRNYFVCERLHYWTCAPLTEIEEALRPKS
jgi:hypothetical protein